MAPTTASPSATPRTRVLLVTHHFTPEGGAVDTLRVGITPGSFCFKQR